LPSVLSYKQRSRTRFDSMADRYEDSLAGKHAAKLYQAVVNAVEELNPSSLLDLGCGKGNLLTLLKSRERRLAGADLSLEMIKLARARLGDGVDLKLADSETLPWGSGSFDTITCTDSFHHYPCPEKVLQEVHRILGPGGHLVIADPWAPATFRWMVNLSFKFTRSGDVKLYSMKEWEKMMDATDFRVVHLEHQRTSVLLIARKPG
jgi:ubiquinone/menaquinone biosynthesis C-methylase UbiE